jgi:uncharacterized protein
MAHILVNDILYGNFIVEPVLEALINSKAVQRLKNVHMAGPAYLTNSLWNETRYEHSIGVMLLVRKLGGSIEEQAAALLHDVSHTVDDALSNKDENCHEIIKREIVEDSDLLNILNVYYLNPEIVLFDDSNFYLLKKKYTILIFRSLGLHIKRSSSLF